jgi:hypothetical protein
MGSLVPRIVGDPKFERYVIRDKRRRPDRFWSGRGWTRKLRKALLFADMDSVNRTITRIYSMWLKGR